MEATITHRFYGAVDGDVYPRWHEVGDKVYGELAHAAVDSGCAETKKKRQPPQPEHRKASSASRPVPASRKKTATKRKDRKPKL